MSIREIALALTALSMVLAPERAAAQDVEAQDDLRCRQWGAARGTPAYFECRAAVARERGDAPPETRGGAVLAAA